MKCKYCDKEIIFVETPSGQRMPCDNTSVQVWRAKKGKQRAVADNGEVFACEFEPVPFVGSEFAYTPHWATCPGASYARRK